MSHQRKNTQATAVGRTILVIAVLLLAYAIGSQTESFAASFVLLRQADLQLVVIAGLLVVASYMAAACTYCLLALRPLRYGLTLLVQGAGAFANRVLPAGLGGLTLNVRYLRKQRHSMAQALVVASVNNTLGFVGHMVLFGLALLVGTGAVLPEATTSHLSTPLYGGIAVVCLLIAIVAAVPRWRRWVARLARESMRQFLSYRRRPLRLVLALASSMLVTFVTILVFYVSGRALGVVLSFEQAFIIFTVGMLVGTLVPTPGGLGGVEAGLVAGLVAFGEPAAMALAVALLFRLLSYWLPLLPGFVLFMLARKQYL